MLKRMLIVLVAFVVVFVGAMVAGSMLDRGHESTRTVTVQQPPQAVWDTLVDFEAASTWRTGLARVEIVTPGEMPRFIEHSDYGPIAMQVVERIPPTRLVVEIADPDLAFGGQWTYELVPEGGGTTVTITEAGFVDGPFMRLMARLFMDEAQSQTQYLVDLGRHFDETVVPRPPDA